MKPPSEPGSSGSSSKNKDHDDLLKQFRTYLHLVITAQQTDRTKELKALPGPQIQDYCRELAQLPDNTLARELSAPVTAIIEQINTAAMDFYRPIFQKKVEDPGKTGGTGNDFGAIGFGPGFHLAPAARAGQIPRWSH
jgi:hypothetical protein